MFEEREIVNPESTVSHGSQIQVQTQPGVGSEGNGLGKLFCTSEFQQSEEVLLTHWLQEGSEPPRSRPSRPAGR